MNEEKANKITKFMEENGDISCGEISVIFKEDWKKIWTLMQILVNDKNYKNKNKYENIKTN